MPALVRYDCGRRTERWRRSADRMRKHDGLVSSSPQPKILKVGDTMTEVRDALDDALAEASGILKLNAALVARDWIESGRRLGLPDDQYDVGARGTVSERWLASTTHADNSVGPEDEGISYIKLEDGRVLPRDGNSTRRG